MARLTPAVLRSLDILELFLGPDATLSAPEVAQRTGLPRTTVHELLVTLNERDYLDRDADTGRYRPGLRLFQLGNTYAERYDLVRGSTEVARRVSAACNETVHVGVRDASFVVYIAKVDSTRAVRMVSAVGRTLPAHCTGVGKVLLADLPAAELDRLYPSGQQLTPLTDQSITSVAELRRQVRAVAEGGLGFDIGESTVDVCCVAAPVRDHSGSTVAAMSISVPTVRWTAEPRITWEQLVLDGARELSAQLGNTAAR